MKEPSNTRLRPWHVSVAAAFGLLIAVALAGLVGLALNERVMVVADETLAYDVELERRAGDLRIAVLDVRNHHNNLIFSGPSRGGIAGFEESHERLRAEIGALEELGVRDEAYPQPGDLDEMSRTYYSEFRPAIEEYGSESFDEASDRGLERLSGLEEAAREIDTVGERSAAEAIGNMEWVMQTSRWILISVLAGLALVGAGLAFAVARAVSDMRSLYAKERAASEELARSSKQKADFLTEVSHELRTPLSVLRSNAEVGLELERGCVHGRILGDIAGEARRMSRMVEDLLFIARSDAGAPPLEPEEVSIETFMAELAGRAESLCRERGASFEAKLGGEGDIEADPARVEQAAMILIDNAARYGDGPITLSSAADDRELRIEVADEGPGVPEEELPRLFERFYRGGKRPGGAGLGLSIAKTIAESHGGRIEAESRPGEGTRMSIIIPMAAARAATKRSSPRGIR